MVDDAVEEVWGRNTALPHTAVDGEELGILPIHADAAFSIVVELFEEVADLGRRSERLEDLPQRCMVDCVECGLEADEGDEWLL